MMLYLCTHETAVILLASNASLRETRDTSSDREITKNRIRSYHGRFFTIESVYGPFILWKKWVLGLALKISELPGFAL